MTSLGYRYRDEFTKDTPYPAITYMMTSSNGIIFRITGHLRGEFTGEFTTQRPVTRSFAIYIYIRLYWSHFWLVHGIKIHSELTVKQCKIDKGDVFCDLRLNKRWSTQSGGWWFETPSRPLWRYCNGWGLRCFWRNMPYCIDFGLRIDSYMKKCI